MEIVLDYEIVNPGKKRLLVHRGDGEVRIGHGLELGENVVLTGDVSIGDRCRIGDNVRLNCALIGDDVCIEDDVTIGYDNITSHFKDRGKQGHQDNLQVVINDNVLIRSGVIIYLGATIESNCWINHRAIVRENVVMQKNSSFGCHSICDHHVSIGENCIIHDLVMVGARTTIESCVFVGPNATFTNNSPIGHLRDLPDTIRGPTLRFGCALGGGGDRLPRYRCRAGEHCGRWSNGCKRRGSSHHRAR